MTGETMMKQALRITRWLAIVVAAVVLPGRSAAVPLETIGGWEGDGSGTGYGFVIVGVPTTLSPAWELPVRVTVSYLYYDFGSAESITTVRSPGAAFSMGPRVHGSRGSLTLLGGAEVRWERREKDGAPALTERTREVGVITQVEADLALSRRWHTLALGSYAGAAQYLWGRASLRYQLTNPDWSAPMTTFIGVEAVRQGNDESDAIQGGGYVEIVLTRNSASIAVHTGYKDRWSTGAAHERGSYIGAGLYRRF